MQQTVVRHRLITMGMRARLWLLRLSQRLTGLWYLTLAYFPVPSESKWRGMVELVAALPQAVVKEEAPSSGEAPPQPPPDIAGRSLERMGDRWTRRRTAWLEGRSPAPGEVRNVLALAFKTLDLPTGIRAEGPALKATTARCPYLEQASSERDGHRVCKAMCSEAHSLFRGVAQGFPFHVTYRATAMMGHGDPVCAKVFRVMRPPRPALRDGQ